MNRRAFMRSLGAGIAAAMIPFSRPLRLSAPKKAKAFWFQTSLRHRYYSAEYLAALQQSHRSNIGILKALNECDRFIDRPQTLEMGKLLDQLYAIKRG